MVRTTLGAEVETTVSVQGSESIARIDASITSSVPNGTRISKFIRSPAGAVFEIVSFSFDADSPGGTSGGQHFFVMSAEGSPVRYLSANASGDKKLQYQTSTLTFADRKKNPSTEIAQLQAVKGIRADDTSGIKIRYGNDSNATQSNTIDIEFIARQITVSDV